MCCCCMMRSSRGQHSRVLMMAICGCRFAMVLSRQFSERLEGKVATLPKSIMHLSARAWIDLGASSAVLLVGGTVMASFCGAIALGVVTFVCVVAALQGKASSGTKFVTSGLSTSCACMFTATCACHDAYTAIAFDGIVPSKFQCCSAC